MGFGGGAPPSHRRSSTPLGAVCRGSILLTAICRYNEGSLLSRPFAIVVRRTRLPPWGRGVPAHPLPTGRSLMAMNTLRRLRVGLSLLLALGLVASLSLSTQAVEVPPAGSTVYIQTNGPDAWIGDGDWYSSNVNGSVPGYHYFKLNVPCGWPSNLPIYIDLFSPGLNIINNNPQGNPWSD